MPPTELAGTGLERCVEGMLRNRLARPLGAGIPAAPPAPGAPGLEIILLAERISGIPGIARGILTVGGHVLYRSVLDRCVFFCIVRQSGHRERGGKNHDGAKKS